MGGAGGKKVFFPFRGLSVFFAKFFLLLLKTRLLADQRVANKLGWGRIWFASVV